MKNVVPIPRQFSLMGQTIIVEYSDELVSKKDVYGSTEYLENKIVLQPRVAGCDIPLSQIEQSFLHELVHWIFRILKRDDLQNEALVEQVSGLLHQMFKTAEYE